MSTAQSISITATGFTALYSINGGSFTSASGTINNGDQIRVKFTSDTNYSTTRYATIDIGGTKKIFSVTTVKAPSVKPNLALNKQVTATTSQVGNEIKNVNDGVSTTRWASETNVYPQSFVVDLLLIY